MFTHLQTASGFSMRYGASHPDALAARAAERGMGALALTDRDTVFGAVRFAKACLGHGIRPIFSATLALAPRTPPRSAAATGRRVLVRGGAFVDESAPRVTLLARDRAGWAALCRLLSAAHADPDPHQPLLPWTALEQSAGQGLVALLGPDSAPVRALAVGRPDRATTPPCPLARGVRGPAAPGRGRPPAGRHGPGSPRLAARTLNLGDQLAVPVVLNECRALCRPRPAPAR